jgi:hypothetical protein
LEVEDTKAQAFRVAGLVSWLDVEDTKLQAFRVAGLVSRL